MAQGKILDVAWADLGRPGGRLRIETKNGDPRRAGFRGFVFHDLRRSAITSTVQAAVPRLVVITIGGHRSVWMLMRYFIKNTQRMHEALAATRAYVAARQAIADRTRTILPLAERSC